MAVSGAISGVIFTLQESYKKEEPKLVDLFPTKAKRIVDSIRLSETVKKRPKTQMPRLADLAKRTKEKVKQRISEAIFMNHGIRYSEKSERNKLINYITKLGRRAKAQLAIEGNKLARYLLSKDQDEVIQLAVLLNPKLSIEELKNISKLQNLSSKTIEKIAENPFWIDNYDIARNLAYHPNTPTKVSLRILARKTV